MLLFDMVELCQGHGQMDGIGPYKIAEQYRIGILQRVERMGDDDVFIEIRFPDALLVFTGERVAAGCRGESG